MKIYIILIFFSTHALALQCDEDTNPFSLFGEEILKALPPIECPTVDEVIFKQVENEYKKYYGNEARVLASVKGFNLKGSQKEIELANTMLGKNPPKRWNTAAANCETLLCAFENLLNSKEAVMQLFNIHAKSGYLLSLDQTINGSTDQIWSAKEIREMYAGISKLPSELTKLPHLKVINRMADGLRRTTSGKGVAVSLVYLRRKQEAELTLYDRAMTGLYESNHYILRSITQDTLIHELCHHYDFKGFYKSGTVTSEQKKSEFRQLSDWTKKEDPKGRVKWKASPKAQFVTEYASTMPQEDFAESCMHYVLYPDLLKEKAPQKYAYMQEKVFNKQIFKNPLPAQAPCVEE